MGADYTNYLLVKGLSEKVEDFLKGFSNLVELLEDQKFKGRAPLAFYSQHDDIYDKLCILLPNERSFGEFRVLHNDNGTSEECVVLLRVDARRGSIEQMITLLTHLYVVLLEHNSEHSGPTLCKLNCHSKINIPINEELLWEDLDDWYIKNFDRLLTLVEDHGDIKRLEVF